MANLFVFITPPIHEELFTYIRGIILYMKNIACVLFICCFITAKSQQYSLSAINYQNNTFHDDTVPSVVVDDFFSNTIPLTFNFQFYGRTYSSLVIGSNGILSFDTSLAHQACDFSLIPYSHPHELPYSTIIMLTYHDIDITLGGNVTYSITGSPPSRKFIISYNNIPMYASDVYNVPGFPPNPSCWGIANFSGHVILHETTNVIELHIKTKQFCAGWNGGKAIAGIIDSAAANYTIVPNRDLSAPWNATNEAWRFTPLADDSVNVITGNVYFDFNKNCNVDSSDAQFGITLVLDDAQYTQSDNAGNYTFITDTGNHSIRILSPNFKTCIGDSIQTINFATYGDTLTGLDFSDTTTAHLCSGLSVNAGAPFFRRCFSNNMLSVIYANEGLFTEDSLDIILTLHDSLSISTSTNPYQSIGNNQYLFHITEPLQPGLSRKIYLGAVSGCDSLGTTYCFSASIHSFAYPWCSNSYDTTSTECLNLVGSYDPNEKLVAFQDYTNKGYTDYEEIDSSASLLYKVNFQNTGTDTAFFVQIVDTISQHLDVSTIKLEAYNHPCTISVNGQTVKFTFNNIILPDSGANYNASMGWVRFSINQTANNTKGTRINNAVDIYFDNNAPVLTNTVTNLIPNDTVIIGMQPLDKQVSLSLFPNPFSNEATVIINQNDKVESVDMTIFDITGRVADQINANSHVFTIKRKELASGMYFYKLLINRTTVKTGRIQIN